MSDRIKEIMKMIFSAGILGVFAIGCICVLGILGFSMITLFKMFGLLGIAIPISIFIIGLYLTNILK